VAAARSSSAATSGHIQWRLLSRAVGAGEGDVHHTSPLPSAGRRLMAAVGSYCGGLEFDSGRSTRPGFHSGVSGHLGDGFPGVARGIEDRVVVVVRRCSGAPESSRACARPD
jgi:hypothetical protein